MCVPATLLLMLGAIIHKVDAFLLCAYLLPTTTTTEGCNSKLNSTVWCLVFVAHHSSLFLLIWKEIRTEHYFIDILYENVWWSYKTVVAVFWVVNCLFCLQKTIYGANVIVFEGIMSFTSKDLLKVGFVFISFSGLSFDCPFLSSSLVFLPCPLALCVL